jgi:hypothetical protein
MADLETKIRQKNPLKSTTMGTAISSSESIYYYNMHDGYTSVSMHFQEAKYVRKLILLSHYAILNWHVYNVFTKFQTIW